jgi:2,4-dienoyl-CoA reductase-like NADH-dependent reductase (Old Yellow Enzyme family)/thioredoxin reductase
MVIMGKFNDYPHVFSPLKVGSMTVKNRIQFSPVVSAHAHALTGEITADLIEFVGAQARSGAGIVTIGATPVDYDRARDFYGSMSVVYDYDVQALKLIADEVHRYGARLSVELTHAGRIAHPGLLNGKPAFVPSVIPELDHGRNVVEINPEEMQEVIRHYIDAVRRCKAAGFDMVMIHGAHGNLLSSFLSPVFNKRTDCYGGSLENRMRFPLKLLKAVRESVGEKLGIEYRISGFEWMEGSLKVQDVTAFLKEAQRYINLANISGGLLIDPQYIIYTIPGYYMPHLLNVEYAAEIKKHLDIPVAVVGGITTIDEAEEILAAGKADFVSMAKSLIADQELVTKAQRGKAAEIRPCLRCLYCLNGPHEGSPIRCAVNPQAGREVKYRFIPKAGPKKKIMVIGGGPAGMMAAQTAVARGHEVVLYEQSDRLGGRLYEVSAMECKEGFRRYIKWDIDATACSGARIMLNSRATTRTIEAEKPDVLILAIGAEHIQPPIEGINLPHVLNVSDADLKKAPIGHRVVICGGGLSGSECALELAREGKQVTLVDRLPQEELCLDAFELIRFTLMKLLAESDIKTCYMSEIVKITPGEVEIVGSDGNIRLLEADTVITAFGLAPNAAAVEELTGVIAETYIVGDSNQVGNIASANTDAFNVAVEI